MPNLNEIINKPLLYQILSNAGGALAGPESFAGRMNAANQQNFRTAAMLKLLQQMLGGNIPTGASMTTNESGTTIKMPKDALQEPSAEDAISGRPSMASAPLRDSMPKAENSMLNMGMLSLLNPSSSPLGDLTLSDLAGLTAEDVTSAMQTKLASEELAQRKVTDEIDMLYKLAGAQNLISEAQARLPNGAPITVPGLRALSFDEWKSLPVDVRAYSYYANDALQRGEEVVDFPEWKSMMDIPSIYQVYQLAETDPSFKDFFFTQKKAGATRISLGERREIKEMGEEVKRQSYAKSPELEAEKRADVLKNDWSSVGQLADELVEEYKLKGVNLTEEQALEMATRKKVLEAIDVVVRDAWQDENVVFKGDGWYIGNRRIRRNPYVK